MSSNSLGNLGPAVLFLAIIVLFMVRRTIRLVQGTPYSAGRQFALAGFYLLLFVALAGGTIWVAASTWGTTGLLLVAPYAAAVIGAAFVAAPYVRRIVRFEQRAPGVWYYRLPWIVPALYVILFVVRLVLEVVLFGPGSLASFSLPTSVPTATLLVLIAVDLLYGASTGILLGRSFGVYYAHRDLERTGGTGAPPLPSGDAS
jgi:hypothetical protein